jgi:triacylglycerol lipase
LFPYFDGLTWERDDNGQFGRTFCGDGIVSNRESALPGIVPDCIRSTGPGALPPGQYCHINMPRNPVVMDRVIRYLREPVDGS